MTVRTIREVKRDLKASGLDHDIKEARRHYQIFIRGVCVLTISKGNDGRGDHGRLRSLIRQNLQGKKNKAAILQERKAAARG